MNYLLDTQLLLWAAADPRQLSPKATKRIRDRGNQLSFSAASIWEVAIKSALGRSDFSASASLLRRGLVEHGYEELSISSHHAIVAGDLPPIHKDPFDRMLIAQASVEGLLLLTNDKQLSGYPGPIELV